MMPLATIFTETNLPNAVTWFYFSGLLAMALFFKFSRLLSIRNWDVLTLFLLMPGLLLLIESGGKVLILVSAVGQTVGLPNLWQIHSLAETMLQVAGSNRWSYL